MDSRVFLSVVALLLVGSAWLYVNIKASDAWLKLVSIAGTVGCFGLATALAVPAAIEVLL